MPISGFILVGYAIRNILRELLAFRQMKNRDKMQQPQKTKRDHAKAWPISLLERQICPYSEFRHSLFSEATLKNRRFQAPAAGPI
jgi:hypothetical protein